MKLNPNFEYVTGVCLYPAFTTTPDGKKTYYYFASAQERLEAKKKINDKLGWGLHWISKPKKIFVLFEEAEKLYTETLNKMP